MKDLGHGPSKFADPQRTASGAPRATVALNNPRTLWFNTGTLCNIECSNCYIESSPTNDALVYLTTEDVVTYLDEVRLLGWPVREIGFTGGEPFLNPGIIAMTRAALERGYDVLILTNAMRPMMRPANRAGLAALHRDFGARLTLRISMDHWHPARHDEERGAGSFDITLAGMRWLRETGITMAAAGRSLWGDDEHDLRDGFARLFAQEAFDIDATDPAELVIFPEMDARADVPEITTDCWDILGKNPESVMCASARMVVRRRGAASPSVVSCTLLPYEPDFDLGPRLADAAGPVALNHPHCAKFCVLGGASCSA